MDTKENNNNQNPDKNFPSKNFSQRHESRKVDHSEKKTADSSARENANTGDWQDLREDHTNDGYNSDTNDNTGGAGSTGSAATNS